MQEAMYTALFGALSNEHRMNSIANNLANVNTTGYKRDLLAFEDTFAMYAHDQIMEPVTNLRAKPMFPEPQHMARVRLAVSHTDFEQGGLKITGAPFDVAISGDGFLKVQTPNGELLTRNGHFRLNAEGQMITEQGFPVLGGGDAITLSAGFKDIVIAEDGRIFADNALVGQLDVVSVDDPSMLEKAGNNLFRPREGVTVGEQPAQGVLVQGFLEAPNVDAVYEMVNMIEAQRQFEAYTKVMQTAEALDKASIQQVGKGR